MTRATQISYGIMVSLFILVAWLELATPFITVLFSFFALQMLSFRGNRAVGIVLFMALVLATIYGFGYFFNQGVHALPKIAHASIPAIIKFAKEYSLELPFTDLESLKAVALETVVEQVRIVGKNAAVAGKQTVLFVIGLVVAVSIFLNSRLHIEEERPGYESFYALICKEIEKRFASFYHSFKCVMGAQIIISGINTALTGMFIAWIQLPYAGLVIAVTFFCGLLPIIGNLISNSVIVSIAFTLSPKCGVSALVFLVVLHKLEYFLNSKIIGGRIRNPMWLTLLALIVAERIMGIPGIILAPVLLHYLKSETVRIRPGQPAEIEEAPSWTHAA